MEILKSIQKLAEVLVYSLKTEKLIYYSEHNKKPNPEALLYFGGHFVGFRSTHSILEGWVSA